MVRSRKGRIGMKLYRVATVHTFTGACGSLHFIEPILDILYGFLG